jgi:hypothetical protein
MHHDYTGASLGGVCVGVDNSFTHAIGQFYIFLYNLRLYRQTAHGKANQKHALHQHCPPPEE